MQNFNIIEGRVIEGRGLPETALLFSRPGMRKIPAEKLRLSLQRNLR